MIRNFKKEDLVHNGNSCVVIHGRNTDFEQPVCIKVINAEFPTSDQAWYFENEFEFSFNTGCCALRKALGQTTIENHRGIIFEYIDGVDLKTYMRSGNRSFNENLDTALQLALSLSELHLENIIHNDINPSNILIQNGTSKAILIDLQIATRNSLKLEDTNNYVIGKVNMAYMAPEQTGRINRVIDYRTDLYSLGVVLYELFMGKLPFDYSDPGELIYAHLAKTPIAPDTLDPEFSHMVSAIIMKLLAKNAEDRYQSAIGVYYDLKYCLSSEKDVTFVPGRNDFSGKLFVHPKLYGKEKERKTLFRLFENCASGASELLLVYGYSGSGKTSLITELQKPVTDRKGFFISGKFEQFQQDTPYSAFILAFREMINFFLTKDTETLAQWKDTILNKVGSLGKVLTDLIPGIEAVIGRQPELPHLKGAEQQSRFNYVLGNFIKSIASREHPLVIFIDDLQWADASSLNLFDLILTDKEARYIMLIGAYRDNEVGEDHQLKGLLNNLKLQNVKYHEIEMTSLSNIDVSNMVTELLRTNQVNTPELADLIYTKTKGNPFYLNRFLQSIVDARFLYFDFNKKEWLWKADDIRQMNVSGNVADLMRSAISKLPPRAIKVLGMAACIGIRFDLNKLSISTNLGENVLQNILQQPLAEGFIISAASHYKFAHDRIQQTIYSLISEEDQKLYHLTIGKAMSAKLRDGDGDINEHIFDLVNHWNIGADTLTDQQEKNYVADLNLIAGRKARTSAAYQQALAYFEKGMALLAPDCWKNHYNFSLELYDEASEVAFLCGEMDTVEQLVATILKNARTTKDAIKAHEVTIQKLIAGNKQVEAINLGLSLLAQYKIRFPSNPGKLAVIIGLLKIKMLLKDKKPAYFEQLPLMSDPEKLAAYRILSELLSAGYFAAPNLVPLLIFKMVTLSVKEGLTPQSPFAFAALGYILSAYIGKVDEGIYYGDISRSVSKKLGTEEQNSKLAMTYNVFLVHWKKRLADINEDMEAGFKSGLETGDTEYTSYLAQNITYNSFYSGATLHKLADTSEILDRQVEKFRQDLTLIRLRIFRQSIANLIHETEDPEILSGAIFDENTTQLPDTPQNYPYYQNLYLQKLFLALTFNKVSEAYKFATACEKYQESIKGSALDLVFYFYESVAIAAIYNDLGSKEKTSALKKLKANYKKLKYYESLCPENYRHKRILVEAEIFRIEGNKEKARNTYDYAIKVAVEHHMIHDEALCWERTGDFYQSENHEQVAQFYLANALNAYQRWGADAKVRHMNAYYKVLHKPTSQKLTETFARDAVEAHHVDIDMATIVKVSTALSGEIVLSNLLKKLMQILIENAGAQHGYLIMEKNAERVIEAEISADSGEVTTLQSIPLNNSEQIARSIVNYVTLKRETVLLDNAVESTLFGDDENIRRQQSKSILCTPLVNQGKLQGIIYLTNDITSGAFTEKRLDFIRLISAQIAISIENALFYDKLEQRVEERTYQLQQEKKKTDDLLLNILPKDVADELKNTGRSRARRYEQVTVMFTDFKSFTLHSEKMTPEELVGEIDFCFRKFDQIITKYKLEKIKTIGDAYLCVGGIPEDQGAAVRLLKAAIEMRDFIVLLREERKKHHGIYFEMRIGINTGPVVAGIVGEKKFAYDIWGDTVNTAARLEQAGAVDKINISGTTYELIKDKFACEHRGKVQAKNKGEIDMYFVDEAL